MFSTTFDWILVAILGFCGIALLIGKGDFILTAFRNKADKGKPLAYDMRKLSLASGTVCMIMLASELVYIFVKNRTVIIISLVVVLISFIAMIWYLQKYAKNDGKGDGKKK